MQREANVSRREFWRQVLVRQKASGLSVQEFCRQEQLGFSTAYAWKRKLRLGTSGRQEGGLPVVGFAPVRIVPEASGTIPAGTIEIVLAADRRVRLAGRVDRTMLAEVLAVLTSASLDGREG